MDGFVDDSGVGRGLVSLDGVGYVCGKGKGYWRILLMGGGGWDVNVCLVYEQAGKVGRWCLGRMYSRAA